MKQATASVETPTRSLKALRQIAEEAIDRIQILEPNLGMTDLAARAIADTEADALDELSRALQSKYYQSLIRQRQRAEHSERHESEFLFPEIRKQVEQLPTRIPVGDGLFVLYEELQYTDLSKYLKVLNAQDRDRHQSNKKIVAVKALMELWPRSHRTRGITLPQVDALKAKKAGLI